MRWPGILGVLVLGGCALMPTASDWKRCRFEIGSVHFKGIRENQTEWSLDVAVHNPNRRPLRLQGLELFALRQGDTLAALRNLEPLILSPGDTTHIPLEARMPHAAWTRIMATLPGEGKSQVQVVGNAYYRSWFGVRKIRGAFKKTYEVDLQAALGIFGNRLFQNLLFSP
jgi:hypothetical protein